MRTIEKLKSQNIIDKVSLPPLESDRKTLVIDLDGTLLHSTFSEPEHYDYSCMVTR